MKELTPGYWCECWTEDTTKAEEPALVGSFDAHSAAEADRWIAIALRTITSSLTSGALEEAWDWLYEGRVETRRAFLRSDPCTVSVEQAGTRITWTARPALFLALAHRQGQELPVCVAEFKGYDGNPLLRRVITRVAT
ncbi:hypothetical protein [Streptomyces uncialis]|uniref:hypothetical protein n=1 Tax=Streptomyces uncialis TaxID=1048205 RepID=UPI0009401522|nr:hypothetical protein [Streptomyces uncialis]